MSLQVSESASDAATAAHKKATAATAAAVAAEEALALECSTPALTASAATAPVHAPPVARVISSASAAKSLSHLPTGALHDAKEFVKYALAALNAGDADVELAAEYLRSALRALSK